MKKDLAIPLTILQIEAANELHLQLPQWKDTDDALRALYDRFPGFDVKATLLKVAAVNQLYGTNVYAVDRMARHIVDVLNAREGFDDIDFLVEELATLPRRKHISFASKFVHFFIDKERFPIYDSFAEDMVKFHLGRQGWIKDKEHPYRAFFQNLVKLKEQVCSQGPCTYEALDRYLWLTGLYKAHRTKANPKINREVEELFKALSINEAPTSLLQAMLPVEFASLKRRKPRAKKDKT